MAGNTRWAATVSGDTVTFVSTDTNDQVIDAVRSDFVFADTTGARTNLVGDNAIAIVTQGRDGTDAAATLNVVTLAGADVVINDLDTDDNDVTSLTVNHTGAGNLTVGLSTVNTIDAADDITIVGSADAGALTTLVIDTYAEGVTPVSTPLAIKTRA